MLVALTSEVRGVRVEPEEIRRILDDFYFLSCEVREALPQDLLCSFRVEALIYWILRQ